MIVYVLFVHKKSFKKSQKPIVSGFFRWFFGFFWVGFLLPTLVWMWLLTLNCLCLVMNVRIFPVNKKLVVLWRCATMCLLTTLSTFYPSFMFLFQLRDAVMLSSVIRVSGKQCFGSGFNQVSGPGFGSWFWTMTHKIRKKLRNFMFWSARCSLLRAEGFCSLDVRYGGLGIGKLWFSSVVNFFQYLVIETLDPDRYST